MKTLYVNKTLKDLWKLKKQLFPVAFLLIFGIILSVALSSAKSNLVMMEKKMEQQSNSADYYFTLAGECPQGSLDILNNSEYIDRCIMRKSVEGNIDSISNKNIRIMSYNMVINTPILYRGIYDIGDGKGIINEGFYRLNDEVEVGKKMDISVGRDKISLDISGSFNTPEYLQGVHPDFFRSDYAGMIISEEMFQKLSEKNSVQYELLVKIRKDSSEDAMVEYIREVLGEDAIVDSVPAMHIQSMDTFYRIFVNFIFTQCKRLFLAFILSIIFVLTIVTMMRFIQSQSKSISLLKMLGYNNRQIEMQYFSIGLILAIISSVLGVAIGELISRYIIDYYSVIFDLGNPAYMLHIADFLPVMTFSILIVCVAAYIAVHKLNNVSPLSLLRDSADVQIHFNSKLSMSRFVKSKSKLCQNAVRILEKHVRRFVLSTFITIVSIVLFIMIMVFIDQDTYMETEDKNFRKYDGSIVLGDLETQYEIDNAVKPMELERYQLNYEEQLNVRTYHTEGRLQVIVTGNEMEGNYIEGINIQDGVAISESAAKVLGLNEGEIVGLTIQGDDYELEVQHIFPYYQQCLVIHSDLLNNKESLRYNKVHFLMSDSQQKERINHCVREQSIFTGASFQDEFWEQVAESNRLTFIIYYGCAVVIIFLIYFVIKVINNSIFQENRNDIITMRLLGVSSFSASVVVNMSLLIMFLCVMLSIIFIFPWLLPLLQRVADRSSIFYHFTVSTKNLVCAQVVVVLMFGVLCLRNVHMIQKMNLT